jgi:hypothetical protein
VLTAELRRNWQNDAIPVMVAVNDIGGTLGFQAAFDFYSPVAAHPELPPSSVH